MSKYTPVTYAGSAVKTPIQISLQSASKIKKAQENAKELVEKTARRQGEKFLKGENILSVFTDEFFEQDLVKNTPDLTVVFVLSSLQIEFENMFDEMIYRKTSSLSESLSVSGRVSRTNAYESRTGTNRPLSFTVSTNNVSTIKDGELKFEIQINDEDSFIVYPEEDVSPMLEKYQMMSIDLIDTDIQSDQIPQQFLPENFEKTLEITLSDYNSPKKYTDTSIPESLKEKVTTLQKTSQGLDNQQVVGLIDDCLNYGYSFRELAEFAKILSNACETTRIRYSSFPTVTDEIIRIAGLNTEYIPQSDYIIVSSNQIPRRFSRFREQFPEKQYLTVEEQKEINDFCNSPDYAIDPPITSIKKVAMQQKLAEMVESQAISDEELINFRYSKWFPLPSENNIFRDVKRGKKIREAVNSFEEKYGFTFTEKVRVNICKQIYPNKFDDDGFTITEFQPDYINSLQSVQSITQFKKELQTFL